MNLNFLVNGRWYKTPCKTVLNAETFTVMFNTCEHIIVANVSDKGYFASIDNISLSDIKCDFHFSRNYTKPKEFLSNLYDTLDSFISTTLTFLEKLSGVKRPIHKNTDEILDILFEEVIAIEREATDIDPEIGEFVYDVVIHNYYGSDTYTVRANSTESAVNKALKIIKNESLDEDYDSIDSIRIYEENSDELLKEIICEPTETEINNKKSEINSMYGITANSPEISNEYDETKEQLTVEHFERLTGTLYKSLFKAIGLEETQRIPIIISNNMVFFNYNGRQYKYNPAQCKVYKKSGRRYLRINWKDFKDDNSPADQKQSLGRSPPLLLI